jgi:hypothetical protein
MEHLVFVFNQCIQNLRKTGWTGQTLEKVGKLLFRLWQVFQAYKEKKTRYTMSEWLEKLIGLGKELNGAFHG